MANKRKQSLSLSSISNHVLRIFKDKFFGGIKDGRSQKNLFWNFDYAIEILLCGLLSGAKTLRAIETFSEIYDERLPDTTLENIMAKADPSKLSEFNARQVKQAARDHELESSELPFNLIAIDGKTNYSTKQEVNEQSCKVNYYGKYKRYRHMNLRAVIVSSNVKLILGQKAIPKKSAETTEFIPFVDQLVKDYGKTNLMQVISVDAGMAHRNNARELKERGIDFIMALKDNQPTIYTKGRDLLGGLSRENAAFTSEIEYNGCDVSSYLYRCDTNNYFPSMPEIEQIWRIEKETYNINSGKTTIENRYYMTSLPQSKITPKQCLTAVKMHWGVENNANWTFDCQFGEDDCPLTSRAMDLVSYMRILAYNCIARFKYRKLRKKDNKEMPWKKLFEFFKFALTKLRIQKNCIGQAVPAFV